MSIVKSIRIQNFKSLEDVKIDLTQLNLLFGANSSGKSSFLKALMFLGKNGFQNSSNEAGYYLSDYVDLIGYNEISNDPEEPIIFNLRLEGHYKFPEINSETAKTIIDEKIGLNEFIFPDYPYHSEDSNIKMIDKSFKFDITKVFFERGLFKTRIYDINGSFYVDTDYASPNTVHFWFRSKTEKEIDLRELLTNKFLVKFDESLEFLQTNRILDKMYNYNGNCDDSPDWSNLSDESKIKWMLKACEFYSLKEYCENYLETKFFQIIHLGTTREILPESVDIRDKKRTSTQYHGLLYRMLESSSPVLYKEIALVVNEVRDRKVDEEYDARKDSEVYKMYDFLNAPAFPFRCHRENYLLDYDARHKVLDEAILFVNFMLDQFKFGLFLKIENIDDRFLKLRFIDKNEKELSMISVSSGLIQILPILFACGLLRDQKFSRVLDRKRIFGTLLVEQPELHLHPALQSLIGWLFAEIANYVDYSIFIETHSEHLIRKLQVLIAKGELTREKIGVWHFGKDKGKTVVKRMEIDENGLFKEDWPDGFFDDSTDLTMELFEALRKRKN